MEYKNYYYIAFTIPGPAGTFTSTVVGAGFGSTDDSPDADMKTFVEAKARALGKIPDAYAALLTIIDEISGKSR